MEFKKSQSEKPPDQAEIFFNPLPTRTVQLKCKASENLVYSHQPVSSVLFSCLKSLTFSLGVNEVLKPNHSTAYRFLNNGL